jgi:DNA-binding NarL/FixJ family response regulator
MCASQQKTAFSSVTVKVINFNNQNINQKPIAEKNDMKKSILVVDDHPQIAELLKLYLADSYEVVAATSSAQMYTLLDKGQYALIVLDLDLKDGTNGLDHIARLQAKGHTILVFSGTLDAPAIRNCYHCKIAGVLDKKEQIKVLAKAIEDVVAGHRVMPDYVLYALTGDERDRPAVLTPKQWKVLNYMLQVPSFRNIAIAERMNISPSRVTKLIREIGDRLQVDGRDAIIIEARRRGHRPEALPPEPRQKKGQAHLGHGGL